MSSFVEGQFTKALSLLHSDAPDSEAQLMAMLRGEPAAGALHDLKRKASTLDKRASPLMPPARPSSIGTGSGANAGEQGTAIQRTSSGTAKGNEQAASVPSANATNVTSAATGRAATGNGKDIAGSKPPPPRLQRQSSSEGKSMDNRLKKMLKR